MTGAELARAWYDGYNAGREYQEARDHWATLNLPLSTIPQQPICPYRVTEEQKPTEDS